MAKEAVIKIKEAEDAASEIIRAATEKSRTIAAAGLKNALDEKELIIKNAERLKEISVENAREEALAQRASVIEGGMAEIERILNPPPEKFELAVKTVIERIMNLNGDR